MFWGAKGRTVPAVRSADFSLRRDWLLGPRWSHGRVTAESTEASRSCKAEKRGCLDTRASKSGLLGGRNDFT